MLTTKFSGCYRKSHKFSIFLSQREKNSLILFFHLRNIHFVILKIRTFLTYRTKKIPSKLTIFFFTCVANNLYSKRLEICETTHASFIYITFTSIKFQKMIERIRKKRTHTLTRTYFAYTSNVHSSTAKLREKK